MRIVTAAEMKAIDTAASSAYNIPSLLLMEQAARQAAEVAATMAPKGGRVVVFCGKGNNGGDGLGLGRWLAAAGYQLKLFVVGAELEALQGDCAQELAMAQAAGLVPTVLSSLEELPVARVACLKADLVVDALLGTGFKGELQGLLAELCQLLNSCGTPILAVDIPSGVEADSGLAAPAAIKAQTTVTMGLPKPGLLIEPGRSCSGKVVVADIGLPRQLLVAQDKFLVTRAMVAAMLPQRPANAHKGTAGRVVVCAGSPGYVGAAALVANAAVRAGAGLVSLLTPLSSRDVLAIKLNEVMVRGLLERMPGILGGGAVGDIVEAANGANVLAVGPGLGTAAQTGQVLRDALPQVQVPLVLDADALTALQGHTELLSQLQVPKVLTPHPGEMARLTGLTIDEIESQRLAVALEYAAKWQCVLVLKGAPTITACPDGKAYINSSGCNAMATGGCGDVLTGIIAALLAQGMGAEEAAVAGVYMHGLCGQLATNGEIGLAAGDLAEQMPAVRKLLQQAEQEEFIYNHGLQVLK